MSTPGPWFVRERPTDDGLAVIEDGRLVSITCEWGEAHLVKAAPDLFDACKSSRALLRKIAEGSPVGPTQVGEVIGQLARALHRAEGKME